MKNIKFKNLILPAVICFLIVSAHAYAATSDAPSTQGTISPPLITLVPKDLGNNEIWYVGGTASVPDSEIVIYLQGQDGTTQSFTTKSNEKGEWFYTHN